MGILEQYFINPIYTDSGYNYLNTIVYAIIALLLLCVIFKALQKLNLEINQKFFYALIPFIFLGASIRAFVDSEIISLNFWTVSPGIWLLITGIFLLCFAISFSVLKQKYYKSCFIFGSILVLILHAWYLNKLEFTNLFGGLAVIGLVIGISLLLYFIFKKSKANMFLGCGFLPFIAHMLDASATFIAVDFFGFGEKHPLTRILTEYTGTASSLLFVKLLILFPTVYLISREIKDKNLANYLLIAIAVLGLSEGLRNLLTLIII